MPPSFTDLSRALTVVDCDHLPNCHGFRWQILNEDLLAQLVAWTMQGKYRHARKVLIELSPETTNSLPTVKDQAIQSLRLPAKTRADSPLRWHRDGLIFQHIAWIAAIKKGGGKLAA